MSVWHANVYIAITTSAPDKNIKNINVDVWRYVASMIFVNKAAAKKIIHIFTKTQYVL